MFRVMKKILAIIFLISSVNSLKCVLIKNQECKVREVIVNNEYMLYPFSMKIDRCNRIVTILITHMPERVFQMLKILLQKCLI